MVYIQEVRFSVRAWFNAKLTSGSLGLWHEPRNSKPRSERIFETLCTKTMPPTVPTVAFPKTPVPTLQPLHLLAMRKNRPASMTSTMTTSISLLVMIATVTAQVQRSRVRTTMSLPTMIRTYLEMATVLRVRRTRCTHIDRTQGRCPS